MKQCVLSFIDSFSKINGREPIESEIIDNLKDQLDSDKIKEILVKLNEQKQGQEQSVVMDAIIQIV